MYIYVLEAKITQEKPLISEKMQCKFIPKHSFHTVGELWEAAVKSFKSHLCKVVDGVKLDYEEMSTVLTQIESCLNIHPLAAVIQEDDRVEAQHLATLSSGDHWRHF